jgi:hypothetical protein
MLAAFCDLGKVRTATVSSSLSGSDLLPASGQVGLSGYVQVEVGRFSLFCWENGLSSNTASNRIDACNSGTKQLVSAQSAHRWMCFSTNSTTCMASWWKRLKPVDLIN